MPPDGRLARPFTARCDTALPTKMKEAYVDSKAFQRFLGRRDPRTAATHLKESPTAARAGNGPDWLIGKPE